MTTTTLEKLERLDRFTFHNSTFFYQYAGIEDGHHKYFTLNKKATKTHFVKVGTKKAQRPVVIVYDHSLSIY